MLSLIHISGGIDLSLEEVLFLALFSDVLQPVFGGIVSVSYTHLIHRCGRGGEQPGAGRPREAAGHFQL